MGRCGEQCFGVEAPAHIVSMPKHDNEPTDYIALFRHGVDEKRRIQIPAQWRPSRRDIEFMLIRWPKGDQQQVCLLALGPSDWRTLVEKIKAMPFSDPKAQALRRVLGANSDRVALDKAGRICIPEATAKAAGIEKEAVVVGLLDRFEIWNPDRYEAMHASDQQLIEEAIKMV